MKKVVTSNDHVSLSKIEEALHSKNIFFYLKDEGAEEFLKIYSGMSYLGSDIYVSEADYEEAKRIVDAIQKKEEEEIIEDDSEVKWYQNKRIVARIFLGFGMLFILLVLLSGLF